MVYAVIDTNILVSARISKNPLAATVKVDGNMPDEDDRVFYEVSLSKEDSFLVTGNLKHFPKTPKVITAAQMMEILDNEF